MEREKERVGDRDGGKDQKNSKTERKRDDNQYRYS